MSAQLCEVGRECLLLGYFAKSGGASQQEQGVNLLGKDRPREAGRGIPGATVARLPVYHRVLVALSEAGVQTVSSEALAAKCGVSSAKFRKDLSYLGSYGTRGVGYDVSYLTFHISRELGSSQPWGVVIVGVGNLGRALISYRGFTSRGFAIVGLIDKHPDVVGEGLAVSELETSVALKVSPLLILSR